MAARKKQLPSHYFLIAAGIVVVLLIVFTKNFTPLLRTQDSGLSTNTTYTSDLMDFTITVPEGFNVEEKGKRIVISSDEENIYIDQTSTNFPDLSSYINDLDSKNKTNVTSEERMDRGNLEILKRLILFNTGEKQVVYEIYSNGFIYSILTNAKSLYTVIDQVAQSFQYTPN